MRPAITAQLAYECSSAGCNNPSTGLGARVTATSTIFLQIGTKREPTSGLEPLTCSLRVITQALQGFAEGCKSRISRAISFLSLAACCTVLRSRWYQSGIKIALVCTSTSDCFVLAIAAYLDHLSLTWKARRLHLKRLNNCLGVDLEGCRTKIWRRLDSPGRCLRCVFGEHPTDHHSPFPRLLRPLLEALCRMKKL